MAADVTVAPTLGHPVLMTQGGVGSSPGYDAIDLRRMIQAASGGQEGVFDSTGWKVSENSGGANMTVQVAANVGLARVNGESVSHQGPYIVSPHSAVITLDVATAHSTNPRIDMVILHVRDNTHDALGSNDARVRILSGTATSGATLDNLNGQASLPSNAIRLADVLVPGADTTISNAQIRDRRQWARGAFVKIVRDTANYDTTSTTMVNMDATNVYPRVECSGAPLLVHLTASGTNLTAGEVVNIQPYIDGAGADSMASSTGPIYMTASAANHGVNLSMHWYTTVTAGSHRIGIGFRRPGLGTARIFATTGIPLQFVVREEPTSYTDNGTV
jgi:hypothetical protein